MCPGLGRTTDPTHIELSECNASKAPSAETWNYRGGLGDIFVSQTLTERRTTRRQWYAATLVLFRLLWKVSRLGINVFFFLSQSPLPSDFCPYTLPLFSSCLFVVLSHRSHTRGYDYLDITSTNSRGLVRMFSKSVVPVPMRPFIFSLLVTSSWSVKGLHLANHVRSLGLLDWTILLPLLLLKTYCS